MSDTSKLPRIHADAALMEGGPLTLEGQAHHYLKNVMRVIPGDAVRAFNDRDGEFVARVDEAGKKAVYCTVENKLRCANKISRRIHVLFSPIKKERMDFLIEKAVELGATDIHPVLTQNTDMRKINEARIRAQIVEAAEQCERLDLPALHPAADLGKMLGSWDASVPMFAGLERTEAQPLKSCAPQGDFAVLMGPSGGFTEEEKQQIAAYDFVTPVCLGETILRSETAVTAALAVLRS